MAREEDSTRDKYCRYCRTKSNDTVENVNSVTTFISLNKALYLYPTTEARLPLQYVTYAPPPRTSPEHERPGRLRKVHSFLHLSQPFQSKPRCLEQAQGARSRQGWGRWGGLLATCCQHLRYLRKPTIGNATAATTTAISTLARFGAGRAGRPLRVFDPAHRVQELREQSRSGVGGLMFRPWWRLREHRGNQMGAGRSNGEGLPDKVGASSTSGRG